MIHDHLKNWKYYAGGQPALQEAFRRLAEIAENPPADGRYGLEGEPYYYMVQRYPTRAETACKWESHRKYIDIQYICGGEEWMGHARREDLNPSGYIAEKDFDGYEPASVDGYNRLRVAAGQFVVFYPQDAHMPCLSGPGQPSQITKIVFKVKVSE